MKDVDQVNLLASPAAICRALSYRTVTPGGSDLGCSLTVSFSQVGSSHYPPPTNHEWENGDTERDCIIDPEQIILKLWFESRKIDLKVFASPLLCALSLRILLTFIKHPPKFNIPNLLQCVWLVGSSIFSWDKPHDIVPLGTSASEDPLPLALYFYILGTTMTFSLCIMAHVDVQVLNFSRLLFPQCSLAWNWLPLTCTTKANNRLKKQKVLGNQ